VDVEMDALVTIHKAGYTDNTKWDICAEVNFSLPDQKI